MTPDPELAAVGTAPPARGARVQALPARLDAAARTGSCRPQRTQPGLVIAPPRYALAHALTRSLGRPLVSGNRIELLCGGEPAWAALFGAIDRAREHINLESPGRVNPVLAAALAQRLMARAAAGVRVNLLLDGSRHGASRDADVLRQAGVRVCTARGWPRLAALAGRAQPRQRSLVVIDGRSAFLGGLMPPWAVPGGAQRRASCLRVAGPLVELLQQLFVTAWQRECGETLAHARYFPALSAQGPQRAGLAVCEGGRQASALRPALLEAIAAAQQHVLIGGWLDAGIADALGDAAARGVEVQWLLPAVPRGSERRPALARQHALLRAGVRLQRCRHAPLHADACVIDGVWAAVGTEVLHASQRLSAAETVLIVLDEAFGAGIERMLRDEIAFGDELAMTEPARDAAARPADVRDDRRALDDRDEPDDRHEATQRDRPGAWARGWQWLSGLGAGSAPRVPAGAPPARR